MTKFLKLVTIGIFCLGLVGLPGILNAQTSTTGTVEGVIADANGGVIPNATVTLTGPNLIRQLTTTSGNDGDYRFGQVPPGKYTLKISSTAGFEDFEAQNVEVNLSRATSLNITLKPKGAAETVDVTAATAEIDQSSNTSGTNVSTEFFSSIPTGRTVQSLYNIAPTVARSGLRDASGRDRDPSVAGSSGPENSYILDGVNTTDPAFGGGGAAIPFEFVQEVEIKTGAFGADHGMSTGGVFNVVTKSGSNEFHGDVFTFFANKNLVAKTKNSPFIGLANNGFSEIDAGGDLGGPIIKNKLTFFAAFNPQNRTNYYVTQSFRKPVQSKITTPFYAGKITWAINDKHTFTGSTFGDFTKDDGHIFPLAGFGNDPEMFEALRETGGHNYAFRLNSAFTPKFTGEFSAGLHFQRLRLTPRDSKIAAPLTANDFAILRSDNTVAPVNSTGILANGPTVGSSTGVGFVDYVYSPNGSLQRGYATGGYGPMTNQKRDRWEAAAKMQAIWGRNTTKFGFEFSRNFYNIDIRQTGPSTTFANPLGVLSNNGTSADDRTVSGYLATNRWSVCTVRTNQIVCPSATAFNILNNLPAGALPAGITGVVNGSITSSELTNNPFLVRTSTRVRDFKNVAETYSDTESFYVQNDYKVTKNIQLNLGLRWDLQQSYGNDKAPYLSLNSLLHTMQPRVGFIWDFTNKGKGKIFANYARFVETPIPLDVNVRAGSENSQTDKNFNVDTINAPITAAVAAGFNTRNLGAHPTPFDKGLRPQTVNEWMAGFEYEVKKDYFLGVRGIYRAQGSVIEDGSFDDGDNYFLFNPGEIRPGDNTTEELACSNPAIGCFGRARRYYRGLEFTFNKRFSKDFQFVSSYVLSSLIGNYEGLFRNDNGQADPNITSLFDLVSLLANTYGRLPNDRPHQFKFNGSYQTPFKLMVSGNFFVQSGRPFDQLVPHPVYGNNEGFAVPRGTAIIPDLASIPGGNGGRSSAIGTNRTPTTWNLDLGFSYPIKFSETKQLKLTADWFNVTNTQRAVTVDQTFEINSGVANVPNVRNPFYGAGTIFQFPTNVRFGVKFMF